VFEEETMGKLLAVGDIKACLAKTIGGAKMGKEKIQPHMSRDSSEKMETRN